MLEGIAISYFKLQYRSMVVKAEQYENNTGMQINGTKQKIQTGMQEFESSDISQGGKHTLKERASSINGAEKTEC